MRPIPFTYLVPRSVEEVIAQLASYGGDARLLAGGQSLIPLLNFRVSRPAALVDLGRCPELAYLQREGDWLVSGPMTRQATAEHSALVQENCPLLVKALRYLGPPTIRNRGTIGGTLAHADRVAELSGVALALGAEFVAQGPSGRRVISAENFFVGDLTNALNPDEMLREIRFPIAAILEAARLGLEDIEPESDVYASAAYRRRVMAGLIERAVRQAARTATGRQQ